jgi:hypothetical protein
MIRQYNDRVGCERMMLARFPKGAAQLVDIFRQQRQPTFRQIDGEEEAASRMKIATIVGHIHMPAQ